MPDSIADRLGAFIFREPRIGRTCREGSKKTEVERKVGRQSHRPRPGHGPQPFEIDDPESHAGQPGETETLETTSLARNLPKQREKQPHPAPDEPRLVKWRKAHRKGNSAQHCGRNFQKACHYPMRSWASFSRAAQRSSSDF